MDKVAKRNQAIVFTVLIVLVLLSGGLVFLPSMRIDLQMRIDSTVLIEIDGRHTGSGFVISPELIVTAKHVVDRKGDYAIIFADGSKRNVQAIRISETTDCAVLLVHKANLRPLKLTTEVQVGQPILVIGSPFDPAYFNYMTRGIVSKLNVQNNGLSSNPVIMIDAAANPGNSGGPVLNLRGRVIGIIIARRLYSCGMYSITPSIDILALLEEWNDEGENHEGRYEEVEEWLTEEY